MDVGIKFEMGVLLSNFAFYIYQKINLHLHRAVLQQNSCIHQKYFLEAVIYKFLKEK